MKKLLYLMAVLIFIGCNGQDNKQKTAPATKPVTGTIYSGQRDGCIQKWDELFCPPKTLASGDKAEDLDIMKDENNETVILNNLKGGE